MRNLSFLILTLCLVSAAFGATDPNADARKAIDAANAKYISTWKNADAAGFGSLFTEDATVIPVNHSDIVGRAMIQEMRGKSFAALPLKDGTITTKQFDVNGSLAYETGRFSLTFLPKGIPPQVLAGRYVNVWKKEKDGWKIAVNVSVPDPRK